MRVRAEAVERVRQLAEQGTLIYVMRYRSVVDYLLANAVLLREGLPLARFAPGVSTLWFRPLRDALALARPARPAARVSPHLACRGLLAQGEPVLLFMRSRTVAARRRRALAAARLGPQYLRDAVRATQASGRPVFLVPLAIFRGKGFQRRESRLATLLYSVQEAPGEAKRLFNYLWNAEETQLTLGREIALDRFVADHREEGEERLVRRLARALADLPLPRGARRLGADAAARVAWSARTVLRDPRAARVWCAACRPSARCAQRRIWREARGYFDEIAANYNGFYFGIIEAVFKRIWPRVSSGLEIIGLEKVAECVGEHPVVLVPCHRSHFDYLIISYIFHENYLSPPHIAAGKNLAFWPLGPLFRGAGAYFLRRTFDDNELYKMVFRKYVEFLIREGYTQEFFIEGGRSRTGKMLPPKLGMLSTMVNAFVAGRAARPLSGAGLDPLRAHPGGGGVPARGLGRGEGAGVARRAAAGAEHPHAALRDVVRELRRSDLARPGARRAARALPRRRHRARRSRRRSGGSSSASASRCCARSTPSPSPAPPRSAPPRSSARRVPRAGSDEFVDHRAARCVELLRRAAAARHRVARAQRRHELPREPPLARGAAASSSARTTATASSCTCPPRSASTSTSTRTTRSTSSSCPRCSRARCSPGCR